MHRTLFIADPQPETLLPFRRMLNQTTELTAENSTPYSLPKPVSRLESTPFDVRRIIWWHLGLKSKTPTLTFALPNDWVGPLSTDEVIYPHNERWYPFGIGLYQREDFKRVISLNTNLRDEVLDMLSRCARVRILHHLSKRKIFYNCHGCPQTSQEYPLQRMIHTGSTFRFLRHVYLGSCYDTYDEWPHSLRICGTQVRRPIVRRAESVRFIAEYCPLLVSFQVVITPCPRDNPKARSKRAIWFCELEVSTLALKHVTQKCPELETIKAVTPIHPCEVRYIGMVDRESNAHEEIRGLSLICIPIHVREELIEAWANTVLRRVIEYGTENRYLLGPEYDLWDEFRWAGSGGGDWQTFRTGFLG
ncbi:hypothetical protein EKO04_007755 [Ascochyta lentis]|uniref:Uncharacterized protein n=1 Tax=Ascochyta lentis TaxID=205686 RepID=A0A8H7J1K0_9PLEO|nr:hypothetical protein EKO04_007755 [Ascochyta lentis]